MKLVPLKDQTRFTTSSEEVTSVLDIPLTVQMRTGWSDSDLAVENALALSLQVFLPLL